MYRILLFAGIIFVVLQPTLAADPADIKLLLSRLDLNTPGMEKVRSAKTTEHAAAELLKYFRTRTNVKHPVDRQTKGSLLGKAASERELQVADDALRHIFVGQPAYPSHFCGDNIDWSTSPVPDKEWVWQLNRMSFWNAMGLAYWHRDDERYAREWCLQLLDWTHKNPRDEAHGYAWRSIEAGIRGYRWTGLYQRFLDAPSFTPEVLTAFLNSCHDHAAYLMTKYTKGSNWALMEAEGMAFIAMTFPEFREAKTWREEAARRLNVEITNQVYPDGHQRELAFGYHMGCIGWFMNSYELAGMNGHRALFSDTYTNMIEKMCEIPVKLAFPDGTTPQFGDSWSGRPGQYYGRLRGWAQYFQRPDFLYVASEGKEGTPPSATAFALETSGLYSMRSGWDKDAVCLVLKCGPNGGGHCQPDNGTFEVYAGGRNLMPDAGSYIYSGNPEGRAWFRQTKVHQTLTLDGANTAYAPKLLHWQTGHDLDVLVIENAGYPDLRHRRSVLFIDKKYFVIVDEALGKATGNVDLHFQLAPGDAIFDHAPYSIHTGFADGWNVLVQATPQPGLELAPEEGYVSFVYTKKEPRPAFRYRLKKDTPSGLRFLTVIAPYGSEPVPQVAARFPDASNPGAEHVEIEVVINEETKRVGYTIGGK